MNLMVLIEEGSSSDYHIINIPELVETYLSFQAKIFNFYLLVAELYFQID